MTERVSEKKPLILLKFGSAGWNGWRDENPDVTISLDGAHADLLGVNLADAQYSEEDLRGALHAPAPR